MIITANYLVAYFQKAVAEKWGYAWSLNGEFYTRELAQKYHDKKRNTSKWRDPATYWLEDCARWIGKMAADCSGGIIGALRTANPKHGDQGANTLYSRCTEHGKIATIPEIPGLCVWRDGHIGVYEGGGCVLEFRGTEYGAVRTRLKDRNFTHWGKLQDVDYSETKGELKMAKVITITKPVTYDPDVERVQAALNALGYDCGAVDGKSGEKTMAGIAAFCAAHGAAVTEPVPAPTISIEVGGRRYAVEVKAV